MKIEKGEESSDFEEFKNKAIADMKSVKAFMGKDGIFTTFFRSRFRR